MQKSARTSERAKYNHENDAKVVERESAMRSLNDRIYNVLYIRIRDTAPDTLKRLGAKHAYPMSPSSEIDGTAMLNEILLDAESKLDRKDDHSRAFARPTSRTPTGWAQHPRPTARRTR